MPELALLYPGLRAVGQGVLPLVKVSPNRPEHALYAGAGGSSASLRTSPLRGRAARTAVCIPCGIRHGYGTRGISHPNRAAGVCGRPPTNRPLLAVREDGGVYGPSLRSRTVRLPPTPCRVCFRPRVFNKFSHFWQKLTNIIHVVMCGTIRVRIPECPPLGRPYQ